jgi:hypothetical protein
LSLLRAQTSCQAKKFESYSAREMVCFKGWHLTLLTIFFSGQSSELPRTKQTMAPFQQLL